MRSRKSALPGAPVPAPPAIAPPMSDSPSDGLDRPALVTLDAIRARRRGDPGSGRSHAAACRSDGPRTGDPLGRTRVWLKPESLQPIGAFKLRGAYYNIATLPAERRAAGVVAHSSGNHAQGVARAARLLGVRAVIVMPSDAPLIKVERVREDGAEIVFVGPSSEERSQRAADLARVEGLSLVAPYDDAATITGQGTVGLEIVEQLAAIAAAGATGHSRRGRQAEGRPTHRPGAGRRRRHRQRRAPWP